MSITKLCCTCTNTDESSITATAENSDSGNKTKFFCLFFTENSDFVCTVNNLCKVVHINAEKFTDC